MLNLFIKFCFGRELMILLSVLCWMCVGGYLRNMERMGVLIYFQEMKLKRILELCYSYYSYNFIVSTISGFSTGVAGFH